MVCAVAKASSGKLEDEVPLEDQESLQIKGSQARGVMMQKLLRKSEVQLPRLLTRADVNLSVSRHVGLYVTHANIY